MYIIFSIFNKIYFFNVRIDYTFTLLHDIIFQMFIVLYNNQLMYITRLCVFRLYNLETGNYIYESINLPN